MKLDDIHLDWKSPVVGVGAHRRCQYTDALHSLQHWMQAMLQVDKPAFYFHETDESMRALCDPRCQLPPSASPERDTLRAEWESRKWELAVEGKAGLGPARAYHTRAAALVRGLPRGG